MKLKKHPDFEAYFKFIDEYFELFFRKKKLSPRPMRGDNYIL